MTTTRTTIPTAWPWPLDSLSAGERAELEAFGILSGAGALRSGAEHRNGQTHLPAVRPMSAAGVLNEAHAYFPTPSSFSRGLRVELPGAALLLISGTASVDEHGATVHPGDFRAQCWRTYRNITELLTAQAATWRHIVRCSCYLRDIERDYEEFNRVRTAFFGWIGLETMPASTGIQARLCRSDLLIEIEALAVVPHAEAGTG